MGSRTIRTRTLTVPAGSDRTIVAGERGSWLEVVDGGPHGFLAKISLGLRGEADALSDERTLRCVSGTVVVADFDEIMLEVPVQTGASVTIRTGDGPPPVAVTGQSRVKWLALGTGALGPNDSATLVPGSAFWPADPMSEPEHHQLMTWTGWVIGDQPYNVYEVVVGPLGDNMVAQSFDVRNILPNTGLPLPLVRTYACRMQGMGSRLDAWPADVARQMSELAIGSGAVSVNYSYLIGVKT